MPQFKPLTSWSFSRYNAYTACPAAFKYRTLMKLPEEKSPALEHGAKVHDEISEFFKTPKARKTPVHLSKFADLVSEIRATQRRTPDNVFVEDDWAFRKDWSITKWDDWNGCWVRLKLDLAYRVGDELIVIDWKTGKHRPEKHQEYLEQLELYALGGLLMFPGVETVRPMLVYLDVGIALKSETEYTKKTVGPLQKTWQKRVAPMFKDQTFKPKPGNNCRWCSFSKSKGGPCQY